MLSVEAKLAGDALLRARHGREHRHVQGARRAGAQLARRDREVPLGLRPTIAHRGRVGPGEVIAEGHRDHRGPPPPEIATTYVAVAELTKLTAAVFVALGMMEYVPAAAEAGGYHVERRREGGTGIGAERGHAERSRPARGGRHGLAEARGRAPRIVIGHRDRIRHRNIGRTLLLHR